MSASISNSASFFESIVEELIKSKQTNYSEECLSYYVDDRKFITQDLPKVYNKYKEKLKCTLIKHKLNHKQRVVGIQNNINTKCIIFLHGLGSSRLEALNIVGQLPKSYCLCTFDLSGSGKSEGQYLTYGMKQKDDIQHVMKYLRLKKHFKQFIVWGRSMGAVATLLYAISKEKQFQKISSNQGLSIEDSDQQQRMVQCYVVDSPFSNFKQIAKEISLRKFSIPEFIISIALNYIEETFANKLFNDEKLPKQYNPFLINFQAPIHISTPIVYIYSENDEVVTSNHSESIINKLTSQFQKIFINQFKHNQSRSQDILKIIFEKIEKFRNKNHYEKKKLEHSIISRDITQSVERKRGIFLYTPSKKTIEDSVVLKKDYSTICNEEIEVIKTEGESINYHSRGVSPRKIGITFSKRSIDLTATRRKSLRNIDHFGTISHDSQNQPDLMAFNSKNILKTIDITETNNLINKKLVSMQANSQLLNQLSGKEENNRFQCKIRRVNNFERKKQMKLTHDRYLY